MISLLAELLVFAGGLILIGSLITIRRLISRLPQSPVRKDWYAILILVSILFIGYLGYARVFWNSQTHLLDLIVPGMFFFCACFVWLTANLSLQTATIVMRISLLERENITDPLTGVFNRRYLDRRLSEEASRARRYHLPLAILLLDIDHFKQINDKYGHQFGDRVLVCFGELVKNELREQDILARYGGEEFLVIAPQTPRQGGIDLAERLRRRLESNSFKLPDESGVIREIRVTCSIGVTSRDGEINSAEKLVHSADDNLYRAKNLGRNQVNADNHSATRVDTSE